ncbi:PAS domain S-box protein (plasmid) [Deinococcus radiomollis]|uniref:PAS domain-containing protein n=1 Tax=Deinococcus radiomollis TaxID=468916 RepID=UPI003891E4F4
MGSEERIARLEGLIGLIDGVVWEADPRSLSTTYLSSRLESMFGFSPEQWLADPLFWESRLHPDDKARVLTETSEAMAVGRPFRLEYRLITASGAALWLRDVITPVFEGGDLVALGGVMIDITAQREAEAVTSSLRDRLAKVFEASPVGISLSVAATGEMLDVNRAFQVMTGYDRADMVGRTLLELGVWTSAEERQRLMRDLDGQQTLRDRQVQLRHRNGEFLTVLVTYERVEIEAQPCLLAIIQDIGEHLRAETQVRHAERRFRGLVQNSADMFTVLDADGNYLYVSPAVKRLHNVDPEAVTGLHVSRHVHRDDWPMVKADLDALMSDPQTVRVSTYRQRDSRGQWLWIETTSSNQLHDPAVAGIVCNSRNVTDRRESEDRLVASEGRFRSLVQHASDLITVVDVQGIVTYESPSVVTLLGFSPEELVNQPVFSAVDPVDYSQIAEVFSRVVAGENGHVERATFRTLTRDGAVRWMEGVATNLLADPHIGGVVINSRDVTERKLAEDALDTSRRTLEALFDHSPDAIVMVDFVLGMPIVRCNRAAANMAGYTQEELRELSIFNLLPDGHALLGNPHAQEEFVRTIRERGTWRFEASHVRKDGSVYPVETHLTLMTLDGREVLLSIYRDITEREAAQEALAVSQQTFQGLFENSPDGILLIEFGGDMPIVKCNQVAAAMNGYTLEELIGRSTLVMMPDAERVEAEASDSESFRAMVQAQQPVRFECDHQRKDGSVFPVEVHLTLIEVGGKQMMLSVERDITERKAAEAALAASQQQVRSSERLASLGRLTAGLAHEINTPLAATMNSHLGLRGLLTEYRDSVGNPQVTTDDHREIASEALVMLDEACKTTARIGEFIRQMRGHTRDTAGGILTFDVFRLAADTLAMVAHEARAAGVALELERPRSTLSLVGDPGRFTQVLTNLVVNAIHACEGMPGRGRVMVQLSGEDPLRLVVEDNGHGMPPAVLARIFEPLFTTKGVGKGTGLGLSIIHDIMEGQFGGQIKVQSELGLGTTFTAVFPRRS